MRLRGRKLPGGDPPSEAATTGGNWGGGPGPPHPRPRPLLRPRLPSASTAPLELEDKHMLPRRGATRPWHPACSDVFFHQVMKAQFHNLPTSGMESGHVRTGTSEADGAQRTPAGAEGQADGTHPGLGAPCSAPPSPPPLDTPPCSPGNRRPVQAVGAAGTSLSGAVGQACHAGQPLGSLDTGKWGRAGLVMGDEDGVMRCSGSRGSWAGVVADVSS